MIPGQGIESQNKRASIGSSASTDSDPRASITPFSHVPLLVHIPIKYCLYQQSITASGYTTPCKMVYILQIENEYPVDHERDQIIPKR